MIYSELLKLAKSKILLILLVAILGTTGLTFIFFNYLAKPAASLDINAKAETYRSLAAEFTQIIMPFLMIYALDAYFAREFKENEVRHIVLRIGKRKFFALKFIFYILLCFFIYIFSSFCFFAFAALISVELNLSDFFLTSAFAGLSYLTALLKPDKSFLFVAAEHILFLLLANFTSVAPYSYTAALRDAEMVADKLWLIVLSGLICAAFAIAISEKSEV